MLLIHVKESIAPFPSQVSERHTFSDKHYLIKESKLNPGSTNFFFPINISVQSQLHQKYYTFWNEQTVMGSNSLKKLTGILITEIVF